ncbi:UNVERIFIED_CONTAM: hypothetical protein GTU68_024230 [Idotea baltica]|nr:hypothetical protein [Idotea baltica]
MEGAINRVPDLERTGIKSTVCGPESFTPDHKPLMGEDPNVEGFFHCCGFNSAGMMFGGGCGNQMAHWVTKGRPELDMFSFDIRRFNPTTTRDKTWVVPRCHEAYAKNYSIPYPHDEPLAGRGRIKDPLHDILVKEGCVFQERHGWERPGWFNSSEAPVPPYDWYGYYDNELAPDNRYKNALTADYTFDNPPHHDFIGKECLAARTKAALFNMSYFGQIFMSGPDAQKAADWLFTANMQRDVGAVVYTCMLNEKGGAEADLTVGILEGSESCPWEPQFKERGFYLAIGGAATLQNKAHVLKQCRLHGWDVTLTDRSDDMGLLSLQGPKSREILQQVTDADLSNEGFPFSTHKIIDVAGHKVRAIRLSFVGELGWEMHVPFEASIPVYQALRSAGEKFGLVNGGYRALDSLSLEKGYVHWHGDLRPDDTPLEAGLGFACKLKTSTPFLGRAALEKQKEEKIRKKLVTFTVNDPTVSLFGMEGLLRNGEHVGLTRRGEYAFYLKEVVARGYVQMPCKEPITKEFLSTGDWEIDVRGDKYPITVHTKQPFDPKNQRVKGFYEN